MMCSPTRRATACSSHLRNPPRKPGATPEFPAAWLSHYEPSWRTAPLVQGVRVAYRILLPVVLGGLLLQIVIHVRRFLTAGRR